MIAWYFAVIAGIVGVILGYLLTKLTKSVRSIGAVADEAPTDSSATNVPANGS